MARKKAKAEGETTKRLTAEEFVKAWQKADDLDEFCEATGMSAISAGTRGRSYRKKGVNLKEYPRRPGGPRLDIDALNALVE